MPEGHLIHYYATTQQDGLLGETVVTSPQGRFRQAAVLTGRRLERIEPYGKHLFYWWDHDVVHVHLGMQGLFLHHAGPAPAPRRQVRLRVARPALAVDLIAPLRCDLVTPSQRDAVVAELGPDPLRPDADPDLVEVGLRQRRSSIGAALLDQRLVSGIGNVIRAEALHAARLHPRRAANSLTHEEFATLWTQVVRIMRDAAAVGRIVTAQRPDDGDRNVYKQQTCGTCGRPVEAFDLSGRTAYACPFDQPLTAPA